MSKTQYLQRLGQSWYLRVKVPRALQGRIGNTHIRRALGTRDLDEAVRRKWPALAQVRAYLETLAGHTPDLPLPALPPPPHAIAINCNPTPAPPLQLIARAHGLNGGLDALLDQWLESTGCLKTTAFQRRQAYRELRAFLGGDRSPEVITEAVAAEYVNERLKRSNDSPSTRRRKLSALGAFWEWMASRRFVPKGVNPWKGFRLTGKSGEATRVKKRPYTMPELARLFSGSPTYPALREVMALGLYTGARIDELCSLTQGDLRWERGVAFVRITRSKTHAGARTLAVAHPIPVAILRSRSKGRPVPQSQLFPELKGGGYDKKLSWHVGQAFRYHRNKQKLGGETDFHSLRRTFITRLENLGIDQVQIARYVGHSLPTLAFQVYSGGATEVTQRSTGRAIHYPRDVEAAVQRFLRDQLTAVAHGRV